MRALAAIRGRLAEAGDVCSRWEWRWSTSRTTSWWRSPGGGTDAEAVPERRGPHPAPEPQRMRARCVGRSGAARLLAVHQPRLSVGMLTQWARVSPGTEVVKGKRMGSVERGRPARLGPLAPSCEATAPKAFRSSSPAGGTPPARHRDEIPTPCRGIFRKAGVACGSSGASCCTAMTAELFLSFVVARSGCRRERRRALAPEPCPRRARPGVGLRGNGAAVLGGWPDDRSRGFRDLSTFGLAGPSFS